MQFNKVGIFMAAIIAISLQGSQADVINCATTGSTDLTACAADVTSCFISRAQDGTVTRGCLTTAVTCTAPACLSCTTSGCNSPLMCRQCTGTQTECATSNATADAYNQLCSANQWCRNVVNDDGTVTRGCGDQCAAGDTKCSSCNNADNCNAGVFPADRRQCYQCTGETCNAVTDAMLMPCALYQPDTQKCYTIGSDAKTMVRGCTSDTGAKCTTTGTDANCALCDNANGCNNRQFESVLNKCIKCSDASGCFNAQDASKAEACPASNYTQTATSCFTQVFSNGTVTRGCVNQLAEACDTQAGCNACAGEACNTADGTFTCYTCRSDNYPNCRKMVDVPALPCTNQSLTSPDSKKCFSGEWDGVVLRGCLIDTSPLMSYQCANNADDRCLVCTEANCNKEVDKYNAAATLQHMGLGLLAVFYLVRNAF